MAVLEWGPLAKGMVVVMGGQLKGLALPLCSAAGPCLMAWAHQLCEWLLLALLQVTQFSNVTDPFGDLLRAFLSLCCIYVIFSPFW